MGLLFEKLQTSVFILSEDFNLSLKVMLNKATFASLGLK